jgi:type IV pilus assembly protein PilZ
VVAKKSSLYYPRMVADDASDRRRQDRAPIELKVSYKRVNSFFADYTKNISRGGTFIGTERPLRMGTEFVFALEVPGLKEPLRLNGRVIWTTEPENATKANPPGMGIEFQYVDDAERRATESIVERLLTEQLGEELARGLLGRDPH